MTYPFIQKIHPKSTTAVFSNPPILGYDKKNYDDSRCHDLSNVIKWNSYPMTRV